MNENSIDYAESIYSNMNDLYRIGLKFYKEKNGKAIHLKYQDNLKLVACTKQVHYGAYKPEFNKDVGYFNIIGNDRREAWKCLGDMSKMDAILTFVKILRDNCPTFMPYALAHSKDVENRNHISKNTHPPNNQHPPIPNGVIADPDRKFLEEEDENFQNIAHDDITDTTNNNSKNQGPNNTSSVLFANGLLFKGRALFSRRELSILQESLEYGWITNCDIESLELKLFTHTFLHFSRCPELHSSYF
ncbi:unnamed protein product [Gordionus sp. m RMFG-2023]